MPRTSTSHADRKRRMASRQRPVLAFWTATAVATTLLGNAFEQWEKVLTPHAWGAAAIFAGSVAGFAAALFVAVRILVADARGRSGRLSVRPAATDRPGMHERSRDKT